MIIDSDLIAQLESTAALLSVGVADAMVAAGVPGASPPQRHCGGWLIALGPGRYINRAVGFGAATMSGDDAAVLESFFRDRGVDPMVEVGSWASSAMIDMIGGRGYRPAWFRNVYALGQPRGLTAVESAGVTIVPVDDDHLGTWLGVLADGNELSSPADRAISDEFATAKYAMAEGVNFLAFVDGCPAGCGSLEISHGVGLVGGAATVGAFRGRGVQAALLRHRISVAAAKGCELIAATAVPTGVSARNLSRHGFTLCYAQVEFVKRDPPRV